MSTYGQRRKPPKPPKLMRSALSDTVYIVTRYKELTPGHFEAITKWPVEDDELAALTPSGLVLVRAGTGGVLPDGTTNHPAIDFAADAPNATPAPLR